MGELKREVRISFSVFVPYKYTILTIKCILSPYSSFEMTFCEFRQSVSSDLEGALYSFLLSAVILLHNLALSKLLPLSDVSDGRSVNIFTSIQVSQALCCLMHCVA